MHGSMNIKKKNVTISESIHIVVQRDLVFRPQKSYYNNLFLYILDDMYTIGIIKHIAYI